MTFYCDSIVLPIFAEYPRFEKGKYKSIYIKQNTNHRAFLCFA